MIGTAVRHYRVESKLGAGGMGVVYRAWDQEHDRPAALKVLPPAALENEERRRRFAHEAKVSSGLNHPNIVSIYEVGSETISGQTSDFIAMELVEGERLDQVIGKAGLLPETAVDYGIQIADALRAAHAAGVVHRDIKPSNIMVRPDGTIKILDFGLAKLTPPISVDQSADTQSFIDPNVNNHTVKGVIMGSVAYMSPEQAEGKVVDARSDIFSLGSVLYEMVSGREAFGGETKMSQLSAVIAKEPPPLVAAVPPELRHIIERCHRKDPSRRFQSMADLKAAMEDARAHWQSSINIQPALPQLAKPVPAQSTRRMWLVGAGALAAGLVPAAYLATRKTPPPARFQKLTFRRGEVLSARFAPTGAVYYSAKWEGEKLALYECQPGHRESRRLSVPPGKLLSVSRKGELAILAPDTEWGTLIRILPGGGAPREVLTGVHEAVWVDDENFAVLRRAENLFRVEQPIGKVVASGAARGQERLAKSSAGLAYWQYDPTTGDYGLEQAPSDGAKPRTLTAGWRAIGGIVWTPDAKEVWFSGTRTGEDPALYAVTLDGKERMLIQTTGFLSPQEFGPTGKLLCTDSYTRLGIRLGSSNGSEHEFGWLESSFVRDFSDDGKVLLFGELSYGMDRNAAIFIRKVDGSDAVKLDFGNRPALSGDGSLVACIQRGNPTRLKIIHTGAGEPKTVASSGLEYESLEWFPDRKRLLVVARKGTELFRSWVQPVDGGEPHPVTPPGVRARGISPDGTSIVEANAQNLVIHFIDQRPPRVAAKAMPRESVVRWNATGTGFYTRREVDQDSALQVDLVDAFSGARRPVHTFRLPEGAVRFTEKVALTPNGESWAYSYQHDLTSLYLIDGLR